jgi:HK97 family phage major capsid protein
MQTFPSRLGDATQAKHLARFAGVLAGKAGALDFPILTTNKAAVGANITTDDGALTDPQLAFQRAAREYWAFGGLLLRTLQATPPHSVSTITADPAATWTGEGRAIAVGRTSLNHVTMGAYELGTIFAASKDLFRAQDPRIQLLLTRRAARQLARAIDVALLGALAATDSSPAGVTAAAPVIGGGSPADIGRDLATATGYVSDGEASNLVIITSPRVTVYGNTLDESLFRTVGIYGGTIAGIPVITSPAAGNKLILLDTDAMVMFDGGIEVSRSDVASIEMSDGPANNAATGAGASLVSMFQTNTAAVKLVQVCDWKLLADDAVAVVEVAELGASPA